ncbi:response regulator [Dyadobacter linearis]|uniref:response regulator n=1 Tax=Dyadobacter linearis TaxID=2823330 RepID=UPI001BFCD2B0
MDALKYQNGNIRPPFIILSDINLPRLDGLELRRRLKEDASLNLKCVSYLYFTTALTHQVVIDAYSCSAQRFFVKSSNFNEIKETLGFIVEYWTRCTSPNKFSGN